MRIINFKEKKMKLLTKDQQQSYKNVQICCICKNKIENKYLKDKKYRQVRDHSHYTGEYRDAAHNICNSKHVPKKIPIDFNNESKYDYHFIIKELVKNLKTIYLF